MIYQFIKFFIIIFLFKVTIDDLPLNLYSNPKQLKIPSKKDDLSPSSRVERINKAQRVPIYSNDPNSEWWEVSVPRAISLARIQQKLLFLLFTADWVDPSLALSKEVFNTKSFNNYVKENLVACYLQYTNNKNDSDYNIALRDKYKVKGYPYVIIFDPKGRLKRSISGYKSGKAIDYFNKIKNICDPLMKEINLNKDKLILEGYRNWSLISGKSIFAKFVKIEDSKIKFNDAYKNKFSVYYGNFLLEDQKLLKSFHDSYKIK